MMNLDAASFGGLQARAEFPLRLRDLIKQGAAEITMTLCARTATNMADDIEFAVVQRPHGVSQDKVSMTDVQLTPEEMDVIIFTMRRDAKELLERRAVDGLFQTAKADGKTVFTPKEVERSHARGKVMIKIAERLEAAAGELKI
ncbi:MAG: hypothetical protein ABJN42_24875 [Roseibium sp.]|uniref:hypothetical protein n=1 Tax=Roseibium sp. TaxID=1936156 RepID=UPI003297CF37